jgi:hypothetical protein
MPALPNAYQSLIVESFHPMYYSRTDENESPLWRIVREYLFDATFTVAMNSIAGRRVDGRGPENLRRVAEYGPVIAVTRYGVRISYQWDDDNEDIADDDLLKKLKDLGLDSVVIIY